MVKRKSKPTTGRRPTPAGAASLPVPRRYDEFLRDLKERIRTAQLRAAFAVNRELIGLYWHIGKNIVERQQTEGWGNAVIDRLGTDLQEAFPGVGGFSRTNVYRMRAFYLAYRDTRPIVQQAVGQLDEGQVPPPVADIPWGHNILLVEKLKGQAERLWYARKAGEHGWSRSVLEHQIDSGLYRRQGKALTNFDRTLPPPQSDLAREALKDPYTFDFLTLGEDARERDLERGLTEHIRRFLLELGVGFAFVGQQVRLEVEGEDFYIDLLFYHLRLRCYVVIELKAVAFEPEFAGKMNFYLSAVDDLLRHPDDRPSIGIILCKTKKRVVAEYALRDLSKPVGVSSYVTRLVETLPEELQVSLPAPADLEAELGGTRKPKAGRKG